MSQIARESIAAFALLAGTMIPAVTTPAANRIVEVFNPAVVGASVDYGQMGYIDDDGNFISVAGEKILGAWVEFTFIPESRLDVGRFTAEMAVPVLDAPSELFRVTASQLVPIGNNRYRATFTSKQFNGTVRTGRYSVEVFGTNASGATVPLHGRLSADSGFYFSVTRPD